MARTTYMITYRRREGGIHSIIELPEEKLIPWMEKTGKKCHTVFLHRFEERDGAAGEE